MPLAPTTYMLLVRPTPDDDDDVWDDLLNDALGLVDGHRHITGEGRAIPTAGLDLDDDLSLNEFRLTTVAGLAFVDLSEPLDAGARELFSVAGDAYWRNGAGTNVQLTDGATLAVTTVGAIGGDYTSVGAAVTYDDATDTYLFKQEIDTAVRQWAKLGAADLQLHPYLAAGATPAPVNAITIRAPAGLAAPYTLELPDALPAVALPLVLGADGEISTPNTVESISIPVGVPIDGTPTAELTGHYTGVGTWHVPIVVPAGRRIVDVGLHCNRGGAGTVSLQVAWRTGDGAGAEIDNTDPETLAAGTDWTTLPVDTMNEEVLAGWMFYARVITDNAANEVSHIVVTFDINPT